jgi:hypothetical protein
MSVTNLNRTPEHFEDGNDSIVIVRDLGDIPGGRSLDVTEVTEDVIRAGHILISNDTTKEVKPLGVSGSAYSAKPSGWSYIGVLKHSVLKTDARAAILTIGQVNAAACPYPITADIKSGLPHIQFIN